MIINEGGSLFITASTQWNHYILELLKKTLASKEIDYSILKEFNNYCVKFNNKAVDIRSVQNSVIRGKSYNNIYIDEPELINMEQLDLLLQSDSLFCDNAMIKCAGTRFQRINPFYIYAKLNGSVYERISDGEENFFITCLQKAQERKKKKFSLLELSSIIKDINDLLARIYD